MAGRAIQLYLLIYAWKSASWINGLEFLDKGRIELFETQYNSQGRTLGEERCNDRSWGEIEFLRQSTQQGTPRT